MEFFAHHPLIEAAATGVVAGVLVSILPGPINISVIHEGASRGFLRALMIGLGAVAMETVYCAVGFASISSLFQSRLMHAAIELISFILVLFLGLKYLIAPKLAKTSHLSLIHI
jgi:threonine/homoserine/homoserine lactone efflux protein